MEEMLIGVPEFRTGLLWGEPRFGHPEGKVVYHIREILDNIDAIQGLDPISREKLRLIAFTHDTFKFQEDKSMPRDWNKHHGVIARRFLEPYNLPNDVLNIVEWHDDAYYCWRSFKMEMSEKDGARTLEQLIPKVQDFLQLYYIFFKCDTQTGDKTQVPVRWFEKNVSGIEFLDLPMRF